jgi:hypothetical protein
MVDLDLINGGRATPEALGRLRERLLAERMMQACITAMPELVLILNRQRQIVAVNPTLLAALGLDDAATLIGSRPGEVLQCIHAHDGPDGCGTGLHCEICGAALALKACQRLRTRQVQECLMTVHRAGAQPLELEVVAAPLVLGEDDLILCAMRDISDQKRREALERLFLHDVANTVSVIAAPGAARPVGAQPDRGDQRPARPAPGRARRTAPGLGAGRSDCPAASPAPPVRHPGEQA